MKTYALVTGASSGIGYEYAVVLAQHGYNLLIVSNEAEAIAQKAEELCQRFTSIEVRHLMCDLGRQEAAHELYEWCHNEGIEVEVLVNNAGVYHDRDFLNDSEGFTQLILNLHVHTPTMLMYLFGPDMRQRHKGYSLNMSSVTSNFGIQRLSTYSSTKGFLRLLSRSAHVELREQGVYVTCVRPGAVATGLYNLTTSAIKTGLMLGYIITPQRLAQKGVTALMKGRSEITPGLSTKLLDLLVGLLPTWLLRWVRRWGWF